MFFAPGEVDRRIRRMFPSRRASDDRTHVLDIVRWAINETCADICHYLPYWAQQGLDHHNRFEAYEKYRSGKDLRGLQHAWLQPESRTLEEMYWITSGANMTPDTTSVSWLDERMQRLGVAMTKVVDVRVGEEQEREVDHEVEPKYTESRPPKARPALHVIHTDILEFVKTGKIPEFSTHITPLLAPIHMAKALDSTIWSPSPLATADFTTTTHGSNGVALTEFIRPVTWILSSGSGKDSVVVVISPYEANELLPIIRKSNKVRLHMYAPRVTSSMRSFSDLTSYTIPDSPAEPWSAPAHIRTELDLFAGQLYFDSIADYDRVCVLLALSRAHPEAKKVEMDGFVLPEYRTGKDSPFARSRIPVLKELIELRQKGRGYHRTHLGQILNGKKLSDDTLWDLRLCT